MDAKKADKHPQHTLLVTQLMQNVPVLHSLRALAGHDKHGHLESSLGAIV
jgi:hypothetical protein